MSDELPEDLEPVYATFHFYYNDPESMRRMRECIDAPKVQAALYEYAGWLRNKIKYGGDDDGDPMLTEAWNKLFACFTDNDVIVPGWE